MPPAKKYTPEYIEKEAELLEAWIKQGDNIYFKEFSLTRDYHAHRMYEWSLENERFALAYARAKDWQEVKLLKMGLNRKNDPQITKFAMQNICRWSDKQTVVHENNTSAIAPEANNTSKDLVNDKSSS